MPLRLPLLLVMAAAVAGCASPALTVDDHGVVRNLSWDGGPTLSAVFVLVPTPGWQGQVFSQERWQPRVERSADGRQVTLTGTAEFDGGHLDVQQRVTVSDGQVTLLYRLEPSADAPCEGVRLLLRAPVGGLAGQGRAVVGTGNLALARALPATLPQPYSLGSTPSPDWVGFGLGDRLAVAELPGGWAASVAVQDNRQFQMDVFEAQVLVRGSQPLRAGQPVEFTVSLRPRTVRQLAQDGVTLVAADNLWDAAAVKVASTGEPGLGEATWSAAEGPRWKPVELRFAASGTWDNPFDPGQVDVTAVIEGAGSRREQPAFYAQGFQPLSEGASVVRPQGAGGWRVRFTPLEEGAYRVQLRLRNGGRTVEREAGTYTCRGSDGRGMVRRNPNTPFYLQFDDGTPYIPIGENICWDGDGMLAAYRDWFAKLGRAGGNYARLWLVRWNLALEWANHDPQRRGHYEGLGRYSLDNAWRLDQVIQAAAENGICLMLCLGYHGELQDTEDYFKANCWQYNPYNTANGGPCAKPEEFWTNEQARALYQRRLRYYLARWSAYPNVLSYEFWNEVYAPAPWVDEMAKHLGEHDIHRHLRTTTYGRDDTWQLTSMDYSQAHHYGADGMLRDSSQPLARASREFTEKYRKPFQMGEFGIDWKRSDRDHDPAGRGTNLHNGMWASLASRSMGPAALWYWDNYVDARNLYGQFTSLAAFVKLVDWNRFNPAVVTPGRVAYVAPHPARFETLVLNPSTDWRKQPDGEVAVGRDGTVAPDPPSQFLFSAGKPDVHSTMRLRLDMPAAGSVRLTVGRVSSKAVLVASVDGQEAARREFVCGPPGQGRYTQTDWMEQWGIWQSTFDEVVEVPVPAGSHLLELANAEGDWMTVPRIELPAYRDASLPTTEVYLIADADQAIGWLHDPESNWQNDRDGVAPAEVPPLTLAFQGLGDGEVIVTWFDTWTGLPRKVQNASVTDGRLELTTPAFTRDVAVVVRRR